MPEPPRFASARQFLITPPSPIEDNRVDPGPPDVVLFIVNPPTLTHFSIVELVLLPATPAT